MTGKQEGTHVAHPTVGELVDGLFRAYRKPDGRAYTLTEVATALDDELDATYLGKLRAGKVANPGRNVLRLLCTFFDVPPAYFFPELPSQSGAAAPEQQLRAALHALNLPRDVQYHIEGVVRLLCQGTDDEQAEL